MVDDCFRLIFYNVIENGLDIQRMRLSEKWIIYFFFLNLLLYDVKQQ